MKKTEQEIKRIVKLIEESKANGMSLYVLFNANGKFTGDVVQQNFGYSASDRAKNGDFLFCELNEASRKSAIENFKAACDLLNSKQLPFGRGKKYFTEFNWYDFLTE